MYTNYLRMNQVHLPPHGCGKGIFLLLGRDKVQVALRGGSADLCRTNSQDNRSSPEHSLISSADKYRLLPATQMKV